MLQIGGRRGKIGRREIINRCNDECNNFSSARACGERSSVGHHGDVREADLVLQRSGRGPILRDTAQAEARESGVRRDIGNHHHVLSRAESQPVHRVRTLRDSRERNWAWSPECPCDGHHWRNESVFPIPPCPGTPPIITPVYLRIFSFSHFIHWRSPPKIVRVFSFERGVCRPIVEKYAPGIITNRRAFRITIERKLCDSLVRYPRDDETS